MTSMTSRTEYSTQTPKKSTLFSGQYIGNHCTLDIGVLGYIGIVWPKELSPELRSFPPGTPCIYVYIVLAEWINIQYTAIVIGATGNANLSVTLLV
jgi:hypothetical protein